MNHTKNLGWTQVLRKEKQVPLVASTVLIMTGKIITVCDYDKGIICYSENRLWKTNLLQSCPFPINNITRVCSKSNTTGVVRGAVTDYLSGAHPVFSGVRVARSLIFCLSGFFLDHFLSFCIFFLLDIGLSVLFRFTASGYLFGIEVMIC